MNKTSLIVLIAFFAIAIFNSCMRESGSYCDGAVLPYQVLTDSVKLWLPYSNNTDIIFENNVKQLDTIRLRNYFKGDDKIRNGFECPQSSGQFIRCNFIDMTSNDTIKAEVGYKYILSVSRKKTFVSYDDNAKALISLATPYKKFEKSLILNSKYYTNCITVECDMNDNCSPRGITKYYFAKNKGLIAYIRNNILWTLK